MNEETSKESLLTRVVPPFAALTLIVVFAALGNWQLNRAAEKVATAALFDNSSPYTQIANIVEPIPFQHIEANGRLLSSRQILIDNIIRNSRVGYFVITAFEYDSAKPLLIVNRGWVEKPRNQDDLRDIQVSDNWRVLRGRAGGLPRVGIRSGEPFIEDDDWPRVGVYPTLADVSQQLGRETLSYVLLLDPDADDGYSREWQPRQSGPSTHYGYAFQWFALCLTVIAVSAWQIRKRLRSQ